MGTTGTRGKKVGADGSLEDDIAVAVVAASRAVSAVSWESLAKVDDTVTLTQFRTLAVLDHHGEINLNRLAAELEVNASTALRMVERLLAAGFVSRRDNPDNGREILLGLTSTGVRIVSSVRRRRRTAIARIVAAMPATKRATFLDAMQAFAEAANHHAESTATNLGW